MSGIKDTATVTLQVNGQQAKQMMAEVKTKAQETKDKIESLKASMASPKEIEKAKKQLRSYEKQLDEMKSSTEGVKRALDNMDKATPRQLEKALRTLNRQLKDMVPGSEVWDSHIEKIKELKERLADIKAETNGEAGLWGKFKSWAEDTWPAIDLLSRGYDAVVSGLRQYVDAYASMDQEMANVRKFTGMTEEQVASLNEEFKKMDTRTSREQLNVLAQEAGRLGKTTEEDVLGYVRAADVINIALDDLGEGATLTLSKLTGVFGIEAEYGTEQSLLKVGSVVNELSQNCSASAPYLTNFAERMGGVGAQAGMTVDQIMGLGAVLDSNAQKVEASATAVSQVLVRMMQNPAKYAQVAGLEVESFAEKLRTDANGALLEFLDALNKAGGMDVLSPMFKDMGENGSRAISALSTLAIHIDEVKAQQQAAKDAFEEGISVLEEFDVQNNTVAAALEKCKNRANELRVELGQHLYPIMKHFLTTGSALLKVMSILIQFLVENKGAVITLAASVSAYLLVVNLAIIKQKTWNALCVVGKTAMLVWSSAVKLGAAAVALFSGNVRKAHLIWNLFAKSIKANPIGLLIAVLTAAVGLFVSFAAKASKAKSEAELLAKAQKKIANAEKEAEANCAVELKTLEALYKATQDQNLAMGVRINAVNKLQEQYPAYFKNLSQEAILAGNAADAYERLRKNIIRSAQAQARKDLLAETEREILKVTQERDRKINSILSDVEVPNDAKIRTPIYEGEHGLERGYVETDPGHIVSKRYIHQVEENAAKRLRELEKEREALGSSVALDVLEDLSNQTPDPSSTSTTTSHSDKNTKDRFADEKAARERAEAEARISYAKGESDYEQFTSRMDEIAVNYFNMLLERTDLSQDEKLSLQAQYWEAVNKQTKHATEALINDENAFYEDVMIALKEHYTQKLEAGNLSEKEREQLEKNYKESLELSELEHLRILRDMTAEGTDERLKIEQKYLDARLKAAQRHQEEYERIQREHESKIASMKEKYFGPNAAENEEAFNTDMAALTEVYNAELAAAGDNEAEILRIKEAYMAAELALRKQYNQEGAEDSKSAYSAAIQSSVDWLQGEGGKAMTGTLSTLVSGMSSIFSGLSSLIQAELDIQTAKIEKRYERETELAQGNSYKIARLEKKKEAEIAKAKSEANRKMFAMQVIQAVAQTAQNALSAYGSAAAVPVVGYILAPIAAAMAVAAGAIQIAAIKKQQQASEAQGYMSGGFTPEGRADEVAGIVHAGEWVASQKLLANPVARPMIETLDYAQRTNTIGSLRADDVSRSITANNSLVRIAESDSGSRLMAAVSAQMAAAVDNLTQRLDEPFVTVNTVTGDKGIKQVQDDYDKLMANITPKSKRKWI